MTTAVAASREERIKAEARRLGFELAGITTPDPAETGARYAEWVEAGHAGEMTYMTRDPSRRRDPRAVMPDARSVVVVGMNYRSGDGSGGAGAGPGEVVGHAEPP